MEQNITVCVGNRTVVTQRWLPWHQPEVSPLQTCCWATNTLRAYYRNCVGIMSASRYTHYFRLRKAMLPSWLTLTSDRDFTCPVVAGTRKHGFCAESRCQHLCKLWYACHPVTDLEDVETFIGIMQSCNIAEIHLIMYALPVNGGYQHDVGKYSH